MDEIESDTQSFIVRVWAEEAGQVNQTCEQSLLQISKEVQHVPR